MYVVYGICCMYILLKRYQVNLVKFKTILFSYFTTYAYMSVHPPIIVTQLAYIKIYDTHCQMHNNSMGNFIYILCIPYTTSQKRFVFGSKKPIKTHKLHICYNFIIMYIKTRSIPAILGCKFAFESYIYIYISVRWHPAKKALPAMLTHGR